MSTIVHTNIRCDGCGRDDGFQTVPDSARTALAAVYDRGWRRVLDRTTRRKLDLCDLCLKLHRAPVANRDGTMSLAELGLLDIEIDDDGTLV